MQLLQITTTPMKYRFVTESARLEYKNDLGGYTMDKQGGRLNMSSRRIQHQLDSSDFRSGLGYKNFQTQLGEFSARAARAGQEAVQRHAELGNQMIHIEKGASIPDILYSRLMADKTSATLQLTTLAPVQVQWSNPELNIEYEPVRQTFEWRTAQSTMEFVPGSFSVDIQQYPEIKIEYTGGPVYVPASANPNHKGNTA